MYRVLLVDDEFLVRDAISQIIRWDELGYELMNTARDGKEAIELIEENRPDLVITDICMPYINGIELSKYIYEHDPSIKVIIISGYDEFEYAKQAVKYQVLEYILKPVTSAELSTTLKKIRENLDQEYANRIIINKIRTAYDSNLPLLRDRFLNNLLNPHSSAINIASGLEEYHLCLDGPYFAAAILDGDDFTLFSSQDDVGTTLGQFTIYNIANEIIQQHYSGIAVQSPESRTVLILSGKDAKALSQQTEKVISDIRLYLSDHLNLTLTASIGKTVYSLHKLPLSYQNAEALLEYRFLLGHGHIFRSEEFSEKIPESSINRTEWSDKILLAIKSNNREDLKILVNSYIQALRDLRFSRDRVHIYVQNLILSIMNVLDSTGLQASHILDAEKNLLSALPSQTQLSSVESLLLSFCNLVADTIYSQKEDYGKKQAMLALDYIDKNFHDPDLSLNSVCTYLSISASYFSMIFKNYTGETFVESLTRKRMEKACSLIENTTMKNYEISSAVGYADPHYFSTTFKKHTGKTPTEYAKARRIPS